MVMPSTHLAPICSPRTNTLPCTARWTHVANLARSAPQPACRCRAPPLGGTELQKVCRRAECHRARNRPPAQGCPFSARDTRHHKLELLGSTSHPDHVGDQRPVRPCRHVRTTSSAASHAAHLERSHHDGKTTCAPASLAVTVMCCQDSMLTRRNGIVRDRYDS